MKIGTDGILLGAWANCDDKTRILDVGTGCGLIALMLAQRTESSGSMMDAIELDAVAAQQAASNVARSPWSTRIQVIQQSLQEYAKAFPPESMRFDLIVCNPPFFENQLPSQKPSQRAARHAVNLTLESLIRISKSLLASSGSLAIILPFARSPEAMAAATTNHLHLHRETSVRPLPGHPFHRSLLEFGATQDNAHDRSEFILESEHHCYTNEFKALTREFYLRWAKGC